MSGRVRALGLAGLVGLVAWACGDSPTGPTSRPPLGELPEDLAAVPFTAEGRLSASYVLLEIRHEDGFRGFVAVNGEGRPVWFFRTEGGPSGATRRANGNFVFLDNQRGLVEVTVEGEVVSRLPQGTGPGRFLHHDVTATTRGTLLVIARDARPWPSGADTLVTGEALWEWTPETGEAVKRWSSFDHLDPASDRGERSHAGDWLHANSVSISADGHVLLSLHHLDQVLSIAPDFQSLEWRLGGVGATIPVDDPFSGQHTAAEVGPGRVLVFDNGYDREVERYSRAVEYEVGPISAHKVWEWRPEPDNWARVISSARRLANGNTMVAFGTGPHEGLGTTGPIEVYEVTEAGEVVWHLELDGLVSTMYRATPLLAF